MTSRNPSRLQERYTSFIRRHPDLPWNGGHEMMFFLGAQVVLDMVLTGVSKMELAVEIVDKRKAMERATARHDAPAGFGLDEVRGEDDNG